MSSLLRVIFDPDQTPPSTPAALTATAVGQDRIDLAWSVAVDTGGSGIAGYEVLKDGTTTITLGVQTSYSDTGLAASSAHTYRVRAYDGAGNRGSYSTQASATTNAAPAPYSPNYPRLGSYAIGGQQLATVDALRRRHVNIVAHYPGWEQSKGISLNSLFQQVKAASTIGTKCFAYIIYSDIAKVSANDGNAYREVYNHAQANNLWGYTNGLTETGQVDSQFNPPNYWRLNYTSNGKLVSGKNFGQWFIDWATRLNRDGGTFSLGSSTRTVTTNTNIDGLFVDNAFFQERVNADYDRDGTLDGLTSTTAMAYIQGSHAALATYYRTLWPNAPLLANSADWPEYEIDGFGSFSSTPLNQVYEGGVIETSQNYEVANHFLRLMNVIKVQMDAYKAPKLGVLEVNIGSVTDYRFMRYWLGIALLTDTYYYPNLGSYSTQDLPSLWFDEFGFNLGAATEPVQTAPRYNTVGTSGTTGEGVWRRDFANGIVLVGARRSSGGSVSTGPSGDQTTPYASINLGGTFYRLVGTQDSATNSGAAITSITVRPRDAIVLSRTPVDATAPTVPTGLSATAASSSQINLSWNASTDSGGSGLAGYKLERSNDGSTNWTQIAQQTATTYQDTGLTAATTRHYRVRAYDNAGNNSSYSSSANATTLGTGGGSGFTPQPGFTVTASSFAHGQAMTITRSSGAWATRSYGSGVQFPWLYDTVDVAIRNGVVNQPFSALAHGATVDVNPVGGHWLGYGQSAHRLQLARSSGSRVAPNSRTAAWFYSTTGAPAMKTEVFDPIWPSAWGTENYQTAYVSFWARVNDAAHLLNNGKWGRITEAFQTNFISTDGYFSQDGNVDGCGPRMQSATWTRLEYYIDLTLNVWDYYSRYRYMRQRDNGLTTPGPREMRGTTAYNASTNRGGYLYTAGGNPQNNIPFSGNFTKARIAGVGWDGQNGDIWSGHSQDIANFYVDPHWERFEISDSSTWSLAPMALGGSETDGTPREIQGRWSRDSGTQCTVYINQGQFASLSGKYLWYVDDFKTATLIGQFT